jgi:hypothetical protein
MMHRFVVAALVGAIAGALAVPAAASAAKGKLDGFQEVPPVSTPAEGKCTVKAVDGGLALTLEYSGLVGSVTQAHVHLGQPGVNGGVMFFFCTNLGNGPAGTPPCPAAPATVTRTIVPADIIAIATQGFAAGDLDGFLAALKRKVTYCNVHTSAFPNVEIRTLLK